MVGSERAAPTAKCGTEDGRNFPDVGRREAYQTWHVARFKTGKKQKTLNMEGQVLRNKGIRKGNNHGQQGSPKEEGKRGAKHGRLKPAVGAGIPNRAYL